MSLRALSVLQWLGVLAGAFAWTTQHVVGFGVGVAACGPNRLHVPFDAWQIALLAGAAAVAVGAEACAALVFVRTRGADHEGVAPPGRLHFFATAALVANALFLAIPLLDGIGSVSSVLCGQS